jgi:hypothetical protein
MNELRIESTKRVLSPGERLHSRVVNGEEGQICMATNFNSRYLWRGEFDK